MKTCRSCATEKPLAEFHKRATSSDGHSKQCKKCKAKHDSEYRLLNKSKIRAKQKEWEIANNTYVNAKSKAWADRNRDKTRKAVKRWAENNRGRRNSSEAKRRSAKCFATVRWADERRIQNLYLNCPKGYHVDHIIPLQGKTVCGLHVENNLQYLPSTQNLSKSNKLLEVYCE